MHGFVPQRCWDNRLEDMCTQLVKTLIGTLTSNEMPQKTIFSGELIKSFADSR